MPRLRPRHPSRLALRVAGAGALTALAVVAGTGVATAGVQLGPLKLALDSGGGGITVAAPALGLDLGLPTWTPGGSGIGPIAPPALPGAPVPTPATDPTLCASCGTSPGSILGGGSTTPAGRPSGAASSGGGGSSGGTGGGGSGGSGTSAAAGAARATDGAASVALRLIPPPVQSLSGVPGLMFGSAPYLWPIFLLLDAGAALVAVAVIRRTWSSSRD